MTTSNKILNVTVRERKQGDTCIFEGIAQLEGSTPFKLTKSRSQETQFATRSSVTQSANNFAKRFNLELNIAATATKGKTVKAGQVTKTTKSKTRSTSKSQPTTLASDSVIL